MSNNTHDNALYDNTYDNIPYDNTHGYIPYDNTCENTRENFLYDEILLYYDTHKNLPYDTYENLLYYDICKNLPYDTYKNLPYDTYKNLLYYDTREKLLYDTFSTQTHENFPHDVIHENLPYDDTRENLSDEDTCENLSDEDTCENLSDENIRENLSDYDTRENLSNDDDTHENLSDYDTRKNLPCDNTHENLLNYDIRENYATRENFPHDDAIRNNLSYDNQNVDISASLHQGYETSDNDDDESTDSLELISGLTFDSWDKFKSWIERFTLKEGFNYKIRTITSDPTKRRNANSSRTSCPWKLNVTYPKTSGVVKINFFNNEHNHPLTSMIREIAPRFRKLTPKMLVNIKKYVIQGRMDSSSIYPLLKHDYPDQPIYKKDLYNVVYQFRQKNNPGDMDASQMLELLMKWKDAEPLWIVKLWLDSVSRKLNSLLWMSPIQRELYSKYNDVTIIDTTYNTNRFQMMLCIIFTTGVQSTQRIESINKHIHDKVDRATSLCDLLHNIKDHVKNEEYLENFELERNAIPTIGMPMLNTRFFGPIDNIIKVFLTPVMLGKQRSQMNQSVCYDINQITEWKNLMDNDNEGISNGIREQEQDIRQILFQSLIKNIPPEAILEYFFRVGTYSQHATFHISIIPNRWYLDQSNDLSQYPPIPVCSTQIDNKIEMEKSITFQHFFSFRVDSHGSHSAINSTKAIYAELSGLSKKATDCTIKSNMQHELVNLLKAFIYDVHNKNVQETQET
ncbi:unnamed protein product [Rhizophagus irregularis]|nr:unnamed protein product [Rhizophagus irregularis]